jgi:hypothetical protein
MAYTTINKSSDYFNTVTYTGDGNATQAITNTFQTDFSWIKHRGTTAAHTLQDAVRGFSESKKLSSNSTDAENNASGATWGDYGGVSAVGATSFTVYKGSQTPYQTNESGANYVAWNWKANGAGSANTDGNTATTVSVNTTSGFSIVKWTGTSGNTTIGHGLGVVPTMVIVKDASNSGSNWIVWQRDYFSGYYLKLNLTNSQDNGNAYFTADPTNSILSLTGSTAMNGSTNSMIAYCFAEKTGYSKFGSYKGNSNTNGTFVYTGFKPAFVMIKADASDNWTINDNKRLGYNVDNNELFANLNNAEDTNDVMDLVSNGFKLRHTAGRHNASGTRYYYMAFGQSLVGSNNVPCTAR